MDIKTYLKTTDSLTSTALGAKCGVSRQTIHSYTTGAVPTLRRAYQIEQATNGEVTMYDWFTENTKPENLNDLF
jgi:hypothetical protein